MTRVCGQMLLRWVLGLLRIPQRFFPRQTRSAYEVVDYLFCCYEGLIKPELPLPDLSLIHI